VRIEKIVDTAEHYGRAEAYVDLSASFERFLRKKFSRIDIKSINAKAITKDFFLKGLVFGNYVTQEERFFYLFKIRGQLLTLATLKGNRNIGNNSLIIGFGADGIPHANAHFSPPNYINLNRGRKADFTDFMKGESSFVHEYGHFLDFYQGRDVDKSISYNFASEAENIKTAKPNTKLFANAVDVCVNDVDYISDLNKYNNKIYLKKRIEIFARLFESSITHYVKQHKTQFFIDYFDRNYAENMYYPKNKIIEKGLDKLCLKILKSTLPKKR
jgi:hypothetical protein